MSPATVPTLRDRAGQLAPLGWTGREAEWLALVALHSGAFTRAQCGVYFQAGDDRKRLLRFVRALIEKHLAIEDARPIFPGGARAVLLTGKPIYQALGIPDVRHRRSKAATTIVLMRRLLSLDYIIARPTFGWLPTEGDKVQRFEALGLDRRTFPYRLSGPSGTPQTPQTPRYFAFKLPIWCARMGVSLWLRSRLPAWPLSPTADGPAIVVGDVHHPVRAIESQSPEWLTIPERGLSTGVAMFGAVGSGKTSACLHPFARQLLSWHADNPERRPAALVREVKGDFCHDIRRILGEVGREGDYIELSLDGRLTWNPLSAT